MIDYWNSSSQKMISAFFDHMQLVFISLAIAFVLAIVIVFLFINYDRWLGRLVYFFSALYSVPSFAMFALLIPLTGLGTTSAIIVLVLYSEYILLRTFIIGIKEIDPMIIESAVAMGMTTKELFFRIQLPLASKSIFSGVRLALTSIIGIETIAATINAGGLGTIMFDGLRRQSLPIMLWGTLLTVLLTVLSNALLKIIEKISLRNLELD